MLLSTRRTPSLLRTRPPAPLLLRSAHHAPFAHYRKESLPQHDSGPQSEEPRKSQKQALPTSVILKRSLKYTPFTVAGLALVGVAAFWGVHAYAEYVSLAPEVDPNIIKWEWHLLENQWSPDPARGGTDPGLSFTARKVIRAAWLAYTYGSDIPATLPTPVSDAKDIQPFKLNLLQTEEILRSAISTAETEAQHGKLSPYTVPILRLRLADIQERLGGSFLPHSKSQYEAAWASFPDAGPFKAYAALKLGDLNRHLGQNDDAERWWKTSLRLTQPGNNLPEDVNNLTVPQSPSLQRIFFSGLVSRSAYLAAVRRFKEAEAVEQKGLALLRSIPSPPSFESATSPQALHALYLLRCSSTLSLHLAETLFAAKRKPKVAMPWLSTAAQTSERVALLLSGEPGDLPDPALVGAPKKPLLSVYANSRVMAQPATALLHDALRTTAEAWNLLGILNEEVEGPSIGARVCFKRAIYWAGAPSKDGHGSRADDAIPESDWKIYQANLQRVEKGQAN